MKTDIKKLLELAGVPMDSLNTKKLIEQYEDGMDEYEEVGGVHQLILDVVTKYENDKQVTDPDEKIVYEFIGLIQSDEGLEFKKAAMTLIDALYGNY